MKRIQTLWAGILLLCAASFSNAAIVSLQDFSANVGFKSSFSGPGDWGVAPLSASGFVAGGTQSGNIYFGSQTASGTSLLSRSILELAAVDLSGFTNTSLTISLAASTGWWESYQEDGVYIYLNNSLIDSFRPNSSRNLQSPNFPTYLNQTFGDYTFNITAQSALLRIEFASTDPTEKLAIDSVQFTGSPVPIPGALWLLGSGLAGIIGLKKIQRK